MTIAGIAFWLYCNNPILMTIFGVLASIAFLTIGEAELKVYSDKIIYSRNSIIPLPRSRKVYWFKDLHSFKIEGSTNVRVDIHSDIDNFTTSSSFGHYRSDPLNVIEFVMKDGTTKKINTKIYINKLEQASKIILSRLNT